MTTACSPTPTRDYLTEMNLAIADATPDGDYVSVEVAKTLSAYLLDTDPDLLHGWLFTRRIAFLTELISWRRRSAASSARQRQTANAFNTAVIGYNAHLEEQRTGAPPGSLGGNKHALSVFAQTLIVNSNNVARKIGQMTKADHLFVAGHRGSLAKSALLEQAFHKMVAARIPDGGVTADAMTEEEYLTLWATITSPSL